MLTSADYDVISRMADAMKASVTLLSQSPQDAQQKLKALSDYEFAWLARAAYEALGSRSKLNH